MSQGSLQDSWNMNRREFMKGAVLATAGTLIGAESLAQTSDQPVEPTGASQAEAGRVPERPLGKTGINVSALGVGGYHLGTVKDQQEATKIVARALDAGVNFFDNAWEYHEGESETRLGNALQGQRDQAILMTKVCTHGRL
jgi:Aldo/keto reductase family